jgi:hypothetical protein
MSTPVKTSFLNAIKAEIEKVTQIKKVLRNPSKPIDRETVQFPVCFVYDEKETNADRNRLCMKTFPLRIEVWIEDQVITDIGDMADIIQAEINKAILDNPAIFAYGMNLTEVSAEKWFVEEALGGITIMYDAVYAHKRKDPYDAQKGSNNI